MEEYAIKFQDGLLKDGRNGLTVEEAIAQVAKRIWFYNSKVPCKENEQAIVALNDALYYLEQRTKDREKHGAIVNQKQLDALLEPVDELFNNAEKESQQGLKYVYKEKGL